MCTSTPSPTTTTARSQRTRAQSLPAAFRIRPRHDNASPRNPSLATVVGEASYALVLLDDIRSQQLITSVYAKAIYTSRKYKLCGTKLGIDPPELLCRPCAAFMGRSPQPWLGDGVSKNKTPPRRYWRHHHDTLFQLINCGFGQSDKDITCRLCMMFWRDFCVALSNDWPRLRRGARSQHGWRESEPHLECLDCLQISIQLRES